VSQKRKHKVVLGTSMTTFHQKYLFPPKMRGPILFRLDYSFDFILCIQGEAFYDAPLKRQYEMWDGAF